MDDNEFKVVRFENISDFDFTGELGARYGGKDYPVKAGEAKLFPFVLADHLATHLARAILIKKAPIRTEKELDGKGKDTPLWDDTVIADLKKKILVEVYEEERKAPLSESDIMSQKVAALNEVTKDPELDTQEDANVLGYQDKSEVIKELEKRNIKFDARQSKANLEKLLTLPAAE